MTLIFVGLVIFIVCIFVIEMCFYAYRISGGAERRQIRRRLKTASSVISEHQTPEILEKRVLSEIPLVNRLLSNIKIIERLENLVRQPSEQK